MKGLLGGNTAWALTQKAVADTGPFYVTNYKLILNTAVENLALNRGRESDL